VDDIFDSGRTINFLTEVILEKGIPRDDIKVAVHDYKYIYDKKEQFPVQPDYWCRKHELSVHDEDRWIHYMSHELVGLSPEELEEHYFAQDSQAALAAIPTHSLQNRTEGHDPELREVLAVLQVKS
jgi:hypoxanthine phosphoribosyltransferase